MPKIRKKPAIAQTEDGQPTAEAIAQALDELALNVPYYAVRLVGDRLEFHCYGGVTRYWPPDPPKRRRNS